MRKIRSSSKPLRFFTILSLVVGSIAAQLGCTNSSPAIQGRIDILPEFRNSIAPSAVLYVIARPEGETRGPPLAVKRFTQPIVFPLEFQISQQDAMMPNVPLKGKMSISARIAQSRAATPIRAGDIEGLGTPNALELGDQNLNIMLNKKRSNSPA